MLMALADFIIALAGCQRAPGEVKHRKRGSDVFNGLQLSKSRAVFRRAETRRFSSQREFPLPNMGGLLQTARAKALPQEMGSGTFCNGEE